ncbi:MAG: hypothetical protein HC880_03915 [Bacteroidia bacterium]|nr:hypothetical protein [Bacteroidia bacterium]
MFVRSSPVPVSGICKVVLPLVASTLHMPASGPAAVLLTAASSIPLKPRIWRADAQHKIQGASRCPLLARLRAHSAPCALLRSVLAHHSQAAPAGRFLLAGLVRTRRRLRLESNPRPPNLWGRKTLPAVKHFYHQRPQDAGRGGRVAPSPRQKR